MKPTGSLPRHIRPLLMSLFGAGMVIGVLGGALALGGVRASVGAAQGEE